MMDPEKTIAPQRLPPTAPGEAGHTDEEADLQATMNTADIPSGVFRPGHVILARYKVLAVLGRGAMGVVYKCYDETSGTEVAVKALAPELSRDMDAMASVRQNFQLVEGLHHHNIANLKQLERDGRTGFFYLVMEYVPGIGLPEWTSRRGTPPRKVQDFTDILKQLASTIDFIHSRNIIHRDIKPDNIVVTAAGEVKILDFGIAARLAASRCEKTDGQLCGTAFYIAPELLNNTGAEITGAVDRYSFAVLVYEMLYGEVPFPASTLDELRAGMSGEIRFPAAASLRERRVLKRALSPSPAERYPSCRDFIEELGGKSSGGKWKLPAMIAGGVVLLGVVAAAIASCRRGGAPELPVPAAGVAVADGRAGVIKAKSSPRLLIRSSESIRNIDSGGLSQGLLQELALQYGFQTVNADFNKGQYDFIIDVKFRGAYRLETMSFNKNIKLHAFSLGADISATYPNGYLIDQVTLPSKDFRIGRIGDPVEALREVMHRRLAAEDEVSFRNILLHILAKWCDELKEGTRITLEFEGCADQNLAVRDNILQLLKQKELLTGFVSRGQNEKGDMTWEVQSKLASNDLAQLIRVLGDKMLKLKTVEYDKVVFAKR